MSGLFGKARFANVTSMLALVVALSGTSYAAITIPKNSVGARELKDNAVRSLQVKNHSLKAKDLRAGVLLSQSKAYVAGDPSNAGSQPPLSVSVPAGSYLVNVQVTAYNGPAGPTNFLCTITNATRLYGNLDQNANKQATASGFAVITLAAPGTIDFNCSPGSFTFGYATLQAVRIGHVIDQTP